jgi:hypothetical protein
MSSAFYDTSRAFKIVSGFTPSGDQPEEHL